MPPLLSRFWVLTVLTQVILPRRANASTESCGYSCWLLYPLATPSHTSFTHGHLHNNFMGSRAPPPLTGSPPFLSRPPLIPLPPFRSWGLILLSVKRGRAGFATTETAGSLQAYPFALSAVDSATFLWIVFPCLL